MSVAAATIEEREIVVKFSLRYLASNVLGMRPGTILILCSSRPLISLMILRIRVTFCFVVSKKELCSAKEL